MPLVYKNVITGKQIDSAVKAKTSSFSGKGAEGAGVIMWQTALDKIYNDFDTVFANSMMLWLKTTQVTFPPAITMLIQAILPEYKLKSLAVPSGKTLNDTIKSKTSKMQGPAAMAAGVINWTEFCTQVGKDLLDKTPDAIVKACADKIPLVSPGFTSPPMVAALAPAPPTYIGLKPELLKTLLTPFMTTGIKALGPIMDTTIKATTSALSGTGAMVAGALMWEEVLNILIPALNIEYTTQVILFMTQSLGAWMTPLVGGLPLIVPTMIPTPGVLALPATNTLV